MPFRRTTNGLNLAIRRVAKGITCLNPLVTYRMASIAQSMAERDRDKSSGQFTDEYPRELFLEAIEAESGMAATGDIADRVGCVHDTAYKKLNRMEESGLVKSQKFGNALVWSVTND